MKTSDIKKDSIVYSRSGQPARFIAETEDGYIVRPEIELNGYGDEGPYQDWGEITEWGEIFSKAPTEVVDQEVKEKYKEIEDLTNKARKLHSKINEVEDLINKQKDKFARHEKLKYLEDFIDGKVTHYVKLDYYHGVQIAKHGDEIWKNEGRYDREMRLVTLYGDSKGDLTWKINEYRDGSGSGTTIIPCPSYEVAVEEVKKLVLAEEQKFLKDGKFDERIITGAQKIGGIDIPEVFIKRFAEEKEKAYLKQLNEARARLEKMKKEVLDLEAGIPLNVPYPPACEKI